MKEKDIRQSNFELMRIVSMVFIALWHFFLHGKIFDRTAGVDHFIVVIITALIAVHVNSFVLLSGYFNYDKRFKLSKIVRLSNTLWFYKFIWILIAIFGFSMTFSKAYLLENLSFIPRIENCWFIVVYMVFYLFTPVLNIVIKNIDKSKHKSIIVAMLIVTLFCYITLDRFISINRGYSVFSFIMLYFIGSYLHKYPIDRKKHSKKKIISLAFLVYIVFALINVGIHYLGISHLNSSHEILRNYSYLMKMGFIEYFNPFVIICTIAYFIIFSQLEFKSRIINLYAKNILGVYLMTDNLLARVIIYKNIGFNLKSYTLKHVLLAFIISIGMVLVLPVIEFIRSKVYKFFYNRKLAKKNRVFIQNTINKLGLSVKW